MDPLLDEGEAAAEHRAGEDDDGGGAVAGDDVLWEWGGGVSVTVVGNRGWKTERAGLRAGGWNWMTRNAG